MAETLKRTALYDEHRRLGGRMVPFAGWELPVQYDGTGPTVEHNAVRTQAGLFDIDHMGQVEVAGPDALPFLQRLQVSDLSDLPVRGARYSLMCYADGGVVDDIFVYRLGDQRWWVIVNAANRHKDVAWMQAHAVGFDVEIRDLSDETYMLALQGPLAQAVLQRLTPLDLNTVPFHTCAEAEVAGIPTLIGATGYTGEYGYELFFPAGEAVTMWRALLEAGRADGLLPCGLAARDSLRFEPCLPLYGHEIHAEVDPISARLGWAVSFAKGDFVGRDALLKVKLEGPKQVLVGFEMVDKGVPRGDYPVAVDGRVVGKVTTGMKAPTSGRFVGLAYVPVAHSAIGSPIDIVIRDQPKRAVVVKRPFYTPAYRRR
ncbi:MAG: glycine cleavage system aminomethyltransferase GcvT [Caldilineales bacterium]|nr:glycine cleavage system aminomethyltransferase GcvT [Caldilineales bacterium]MDW8317396.1 glycine cleavage system aminomethyltransferase GcvT [Anaerolineae bacterium]